MPGLDDEGGPGLIHLVVAMPAEARPLIRRFGLGRVAGDGPPVWGRGDISLVVSGVGRAAAAAAVDRLAGDRAGEAAWINFGVGGHRSLPLGEIVVARAVINAEDGHVWRSVLAFEPPCATATVTTVDREETVYPEDTVYEMEAAGFCAVAARFAAAELVQVVKVISDNAAAPAAALTAARVEELINLRSETIAEIVEQVAALAG